MISNPRFPHDVLITRSDDPGYFSSEQTPIREVYRGKGRSYLERTSIDKVIISQRMLSLPIIDTSIMEGDSLEVTILSRVERGRVVDVIVTNFGTNVKWEYVRN